MSKLFTRDSVDGPELSGANLLAANVALFDALQSIGLQSGSRTAITASATLAAAQCGYLPVSCAGGSVTLTLPTSGAAADDYEYRIRRTDSTSANTLTIQRGSTDTIEGATSFTIGVGEQYDIKLPGGGADWKILGRGGATAAAARSVISAALQATRADLATAATLDFTGTTTTDDFRLTGTTTATAINIAVGRTCRALAQSAFKITNNSALVCASGDDIYIRAGDFIIFRATAANTAEVTVIRANPIVRRAAQTTSGSANYDFTDIPADVNVVHCHGSGLSSSTASTFLVQIGAGSVDSSGYTGAASGLTDGASPVYSPSSSGFFAGTTAAGADTVSFELELKRRTSNEWQCSGKIFREGTTDVVWTSMQEKSLSGPLDRVRFTTAAGHTLDAVSVSLTYQS